MKILLDAMKVRKQNEGKIFLANLIIIVSIMCMSYVSIDIIHSLLKTYAILYAIFCIYILYARLKICYWVFWPVFVHNLAFMAVELDEVGFTYFFPVYLLNFGFSIILGLRATSLRNSRGRP